VREALVNSIKFDAANFFYAGLVLLAPNLVNKFSSVFSIFKP